MSKATTGQAEVLRLRQDVQALLCRRILEAIELVLEEELTEVLGVAEDGLAAREAYGASVAKWRALCPAVTRSLEEGCE